MISEVLQQIWQGMRSALKSPAGEESREVEEEQVFQGVAVNPFMLFLILILLILGFSGWNGGVNPFMLFLILVLLILGFCPNAVIC